VFLAFSFNIDGGVAIFDATGTNLKKKFCFNEQKFSF
jgi:hypothetical protein